MSFPDRGEDTPMAMLSGGVPDARWNAPASVDGAGARSARVTAVAAGAWRLRRALRGAAGAGGKDRRTALELSARARRTLKGIVAADQQFEALSAAPTSVFVQWHVEAIIARPAEMSYVDHGAPRRGAGRKGISNRSRRMPDK